MRARIKTLEEMPADEKCCAAMIERIRPYQGMEIEVLPEPFDMALNPCPDCGAARNPKTGLMWVGQPFALPIDCLDIDEGSIN